MRYWLLAAALVFALAGCETTKKKSNEPAPDSGSESGEKDGVWREDQKTGEKKPADTAEKPADKTADTGEQKSSDSQPTKTEDPAPAKVDNQPKDPPPPETSKTEPVKSEKPAEPVSSQPADPKAHDKLADEFISAVKGMGPALKKSKSWVQYEADRKNFADKQEKAMEERRKGGDKQVLEQAWADAINAWYEARYSLKRFQKLHSNPRGFETVSVNSKGAVLKLTDDQLRSADCRKANGASTLSDPETQELNMFRNTTLKYDLTANGVFESKDWAKVFGDAQKKFDEAANDKFDEADLKKFKD